MGKIFHKRSEPAREMFWIQWKLLGYRADQLVSFDECSVNTGHWLRPRGWGVRSSPLIRWLALHVAGADPLLCLAVHFALLTLTLGGTSRHGLQGEAGQRQGPQHARCATQLVCGDVLRRPLCDGGLQEQREPRDVDVLLAAPPHSSHASLPHAQ